MKMRRNKRKDERISNLNEKVKILTKDHNGYYHASWEIEKGVRRSQKDE